MTTHPAETVHHALREEPCDDTWWMPGPNGFAACALSGSARTVADARRFTRATIESWQLCAGVAEDAATVVSELVTNALRYGTSDGGLGDICPAWLALTRQQATVLCAVSDSGTTAPVVREPDAFAESGRGLHIVGLLSDAWGWTPPDRLGKTVWATVSTRG
ncbi:ATP-binding protein [Streptomyces sp. NPDC048650]|uniref:ATP-binding protein n=1 Tax=unclassified Streptomyces TaxID=2593676 RepID=UPI003710AB44